ncbi:MAG: GNVR domain-containing protein, partial [Bacteroidota bacterium]
DEETGILNLNTELPDPNAAAEVTRLALEDLRKYIIDYQTEKAQKDLDFIENQFIDSKQRFQSAQKKLASFRDENMNVVTAKAQTEEQRLEAEYDLTFNVYNGLAQQYEQAKIKVQEKTPVFKVVNEAKVPLERSKPRKSLIMIVMVFLGGFIGIGWIILRLIWQSISKDYQSISL